MSEPRTPKRRSTYIVPTDGMQGAFDRGEPVLLLPPDWPEGNAALLHLFIDVATNGSKGRLLIMPIEASDR